MALPLPPVLSAAAQMQPTLEVPAQWESWRSEEAWITLGRFEGPRALGKKRSLPSGTQEEDHTGFLLQNKAPGSRVSTA